jgi:glycosyltransferase involved in cell wall biosynthesis
MRSEPRVSVVVPVRDGELYLEHALASIAAQSRRPSEVIVVDDGSMDASARIAERLGARVERQPPSGQAAARNRGVAVSSGDLVAFLDADDLWPADRLERAVEALRARPDVDMLFGWCRQFDGATDDGHPGVPATSRLRPPQPGRLPGAMLVRRSALDRVGPFSTEWRVGELMEWLFRAYDAGLNELVTPDVVLYRRVHAANLSRDEESRFDHVRILRRELARRRGRAGG